MDSEQLQSVICQRRSVRAFKAQPLSANDEQYVKQCIKEADNPFGESVRIHFIKRSPDAKGEKLGTYGVIRGASAFLGASANASPMAPLAVGYQMEKMVLALTARGLGSVWVAGTFKRSDFARAMKIGADEWLPAIVPFGYAQEKTGVFDQVIRAVAKPESREEWRYLFTQDGFQIQLSEEAAGSYALPLEMLRLAPSSHNGQPWRVVKKDRVFYFYESHKASASEQEARIKGIDLGIGICHFHLLAQSLGLKGHFAHLPLTEGRIPEDTFYHISWICD